MLILQQVRAYAPRKREISMSKRKGPRQEKYAACSLDKDIFTMLPKVKRIVCSPIDFLLQCPGDGAEKMRSGSKVYVLPQLEGNVSRGFSWPFIVNVLPLDGLKVSVFLAIGGELNMKGISKWAGRLQTSA